MLDTAPLSENLGVEILGIDLGDVDDSTVREILAALHEHQVVLFRGQKITPEQFHRFGCHLGEPIPHVLDHLRLSGLPGVMRLTNVVKQDSQRLNGAAYWHTDQSYEAEPSSATTLHAIQVPDKGGGTEFANMFAAYDDLSEAMKHRIAGLTAAHLYGNRDEGQAGEAAATPLRNEEQRAHVPMVHHPLVRPRPVTGRKALYAVTGTSRGIVGWPEDVGLALLGELKAHATQPRYVHTQIYRAGDVIVWDTSSTVHRAQMMEAATGDHDTRLMHRISVRGLPPLLSRSA